MYTHSLYTTVHYVQNYNNYIGDSDGKESAYNAEDPGSIP